MNVYEICDKLWERAFGPDFCKAIREEYHNEDFQDIEADLRTGKTKLLNSCSGDGEESFYRAERLYNRAAQITAEDAFFAGLFAAFRHYFMPGRFDDLSFHELVALGQLNDSVSPATAGRRALEAEANHIVEALAKPSVAETEEHVTSVCCGWGQRIYYAGFVSFRWGYISAWNILRKIDPAVTPSVFSAEVLSFEASGGYIYHADLGSSSEMIDAETAVNS